MKNLIQMIKSIFIKNKPIYLSKKIIFLDETDMWFAKKHPELSKMKG